MPFYTYILQSESTGQIYIGQTNDLDRRLLEHNDPDFKGTYHTKRRIGPWSIIYFEEYSSRSEAMCREKELKSGKGRRWIKQYVLK